MMLGVYWRSAVLLVVIPVMFFTTLSFATGFVAVGCRCVSPLALRLWGGFSISIASLMVRLVLMSTAAKILVLSKSMRCEVVWTCWAKDEVFPLFVNGVPVFFSSGTSFSVCLSYITCRTVLARDFVDSLLFQPYFRFCRSIADCSVCVEGRLYIVLPQDSTDFVCHPFDIRQRRFRNGFHFILFRFPAPRFLSPLNIGVGETVCLKTVRCTILSSSFLLSASTSLSALLTRVLMTECSCAGWWWNFVLRYRSVWVGLRYTVCPRLPSGFFLIRTSKKGSWLFYSTPIVNLIFGCMLFRWCRRHILVITVACGWRPWSLVPLDVP